MPRLLLLPLGLIVVLLVASQLILPPLAERKVEDRLEEGGGSANAEIGAFPAVRLLFGGDGDRLEATGSDLKLDVTRRQRVLERLDGFDEVEVELVDFTVGPFELDRFSMTRGEGDRAYRTSFSGEASPREVATFLGSEAGGPLGGLLGGLAAGTLLSRGDAPLPMQVRAEVRSRDGRVEVTRTSGSVGGVPAGPLAQLVIELVVRRL
jgi:hypothetical protein